MFTSNVAPNPRRRKYLFAFVLITGLAVAASAYWGLESRFEVGELTSLPPLPQGFELKDFWFRDDDQLSLVLSRPRQATIAVWNWRRGVKGEAPQQVDLLAQAPGGDLLGEARYSYGVQSRKAGINFIPYAVSRDGKTLAAVVADKLYVGGPSNWAKAVQVPLLPPDRSQAPFSPVEAIAFTAPGLITMVHSDGSMDHCNFSKSLVGDWSTNLPGIPFLWSGGSRLLISLPRTDAFSLFEVQGFDSVRYGSGKLNLQYQEVTAAAVSPDGSRVVFGSSDGIVYLQDIKKGEFSPVFPENERVGIPLRDSRPVRALAMLAQGDMLIGGDFQNIYLLGADLRPKIIAETESGVRLIATRENSLVYATAQRVVAARIASRTRLYGAGLSWILSIYATAISVLAFLFALAPDGLSREAPPSPKGDKPDGRRNVSSRSRRSR